MALKDGLIAVWCESSNPFDDQHTNALTLTDNNTVGTAAGKVGTAGDFELDSSEFLSRNDEALLSTGDIDFTVAAWVKMESKAASGSNNYMASKGTGVLDAIEWALLYQNFTGQDRFAFFIANFAVGVRADIFGSPSTGTWYYLQAQHDAANNKIRIRGNNGAWEEQATGGTAPADTVGPLYLGRYVGLLPLFFDGLLNQVAFWKAVKSDADLNAIYNAGAGLAFDQWDAPIFVSGSCADAGRNFDLPYQDITIVFNEAVKDVALTVGGSASGHTIKVGGVAQTTTYRSGSGTATWTLRVPAIVRQGNTVTWSYDRTAGATISVATNNELVPNTDKTITNNLTKRIRLKLRDKSDAIVSGSVKLGVFRYGGGSVADADWMLREQKQSATTGSDGLIDVQYTGALSPLDTVYIGVLLNTESMVWHQAVD